jgi:molybdenum-dependent DNA-binding transcriptional regulator ModE
MRRRDIKHTFKVSLTSLTLQLLENARKNNSNAHLTKVEKDLIMGYIARQKKLQDLREASSDDESVAAVETMQNEEYYDQAISQMIAKMN